MQQDDNTKARADILFNMENIPNWIAEGTKGRYWKNVETGTLLCIRYNDLQETWEVSGQKSQIDTADSEEQARKKAKEYMRNHPKPSPMV